MNQEPNEKPPVVFVACRRGKDPNTIGTCDGRQAYNRTRPGAHASQFECVKCGCTWVVPTGGHFNF